MDTDPLFQFRCYAGDGQAASIRVGWRWNEELVKATEVKEAWVLVCIFAKDQRIESRKLFPLLDQEGWISFEASGVNRIRALVLTGDAKEVALRPSGNTGYYSSFVHWSKFDPLDGTPLDEVEASLYTGEQHRFIEKGRSTKMFRCEPVRGTLCGEDYTVDSEFFAKPMPQWKRQYLSKFFAASTKDQCHTRKRMWFFGYPFLPFYLLGSELARVVMLIAMAFAGIRHPGAKAVLHPFSMNTLDVGTDDADVTSRWFVDKKGRPWFVGMWFLAPPVITLCIGITWLLGRIPTGVKVVRVPNAKNSGTHPVELATTGWFGPLSHDIVIVLVFLTLSCLLAWMVLGIALGLTAIFDPLSASAEKKKTRQRTKQKERVAVQSAKLAAQREREQAAMLALARQDLSANPTPLPKVPVPWNRKSVHLWFTGVKTKVCKPYSK